MALFQVRSETHHLGFAPPEFSWGSAFGKVACNGEYDQRNSKWLADARLTTSEQVSDQLDSKVKI